MTSGSSFSRLARQHASQVAEMNASTIMAPNPKTRIPPKIGIVKRTCLIRRASSTTEPNFIRVIRRAWRYRTTYYSAAQEHIVDQTGIPDTDGQESHGAGCSGPTSSSGSRFSRFSPRHSRAWRAARILSFHAESVEPDRPGARRRRPRSRARSRARKSTHGRLSFVGIQIAIAAAHRQSVRLANRRAGVNLDGQVQVFDHPADQELLLVVLLTEAGQIGPDDLEELENDGRHAPEMARPAGPFENVAKIGNFDECRCARHWDKSSRALGAKTRAPAAWHRFEVVVEAGDSGRNLHSARTGSG